MNQISLKRSNLFFNISYMCILHVFFKIKSDWNVMKVKNKLNSRSSGKTFKMFIIIVSALELSNAIQ